MISLRLGNIRPIVTDDTIAHTLKKIYFERGTERKVSGRWLDSLIHEADKGLEKSALLAPFAGFIQRLRASYPKAEEFVSIAGLDLLRLLNLIVGYRAEQGITVEGFDYKRLKDILDMPDTGAICKAEAVGAQPWEALREEVLKMGIKNTVMVAEMPMEPPAQVMSSVFHGIFPIREF